MGRVPVENAEGIVDRTDRRRQPPKPGFAPSIRDPEPAPSSKKPLRLMAWALLVLSTGLLWSVRHIEAAEAEPLTQDDTSAPWNIATPTMGGMQTWTDELVFRDWRIQRQSITGHCRLLDDRNHRRAWGTFEQCRARLNELKQQLELTPIRGTVVLVLHGLIRSRHSMTPMVEALRDASKPGQAPGIGNLEPAPFSETGDWTVMNVSYASTRDGIDGHAEAFGRVVDHLDPEVTQIHLVAHSLGNLVIRRYLHDCHTGQNGRRPDPRLGRIVMLTPPNNGARFAEAFRNAGFLEPVLGKSSAQLAKEWETVSRTLATPRCEFGILAGGKSDGEGINRLLDGDDDFVVAVDETRLPGARDFLVLPVFHRQIISDPTAQECTVRFLKHGYFRSPEQRQPLPLTTDLRP